MARATLEALIERVRSLTGIDDEFTADEIAAALDATRVHHRDAPLFPDSSATTSTVWMSFSDGWEDGYEIVNGSDDALAESTGSDYSEPIVGRFVLASATSGPVYISGRTYDLYSAAAELLTSWAARVAKDFDFSADGQSFSRSQKREGLLELAREFRSRTKPRTGSLIRPDEAS